MRHLFDSDEVTDTDARASDADKSLACQFLVLLRVDFAVSLESTDVIHRLATHRHKYHKYLEERKTIISAALNLELCPSSRGRYVLTDKEDGFHSICKFKICLR